MNTRNISKIAIIGIIFIASISIKLQADIMFGACPILDKSKIITFNKSGINAFTNYNLTFRPDLASRPDQIFVAFQVHYSNPGDETIDLNVDSTQTFFFEIRTNELLSAIGPLAITYPQYLPIQHIVKYGDWFTAYAWEFRLHQDLFPSYPDAVKFRKMSFFSSYDEVSGQIGIGWDAKPPSTVGYYKGVIGTTNQLDQMTFGLDNNNFYYNQKCGLIDRGTRSYNYIDPYDGLFKTNCNYYFREADAKDSNSLGFNHFKERTDLNEVAHNAGIDTTVAMLKKNMWVNIDSNNHTLATFWVNCDRERPPMYYTELFGIMFINIDDLGNIISTKVVYEDNPFNIMSLGYYVANNHIYIFGVRNDYDLLIREMTFEGETVKEFYYDNNIYSTEILKYFERENIAIKTKITEKKEFYFYGSVQETSNYFCNFYLAKYDSTMKLIYEKMWTPSGEETGLDRINISNTTQSYLDEIIIKGDTVYVCGTLFNYAEDNLGLILKTDQSLYFAKFLENKTSISIPTQLLASSLYPNPANGENTKIALELENACDVKIVLTNVLGQELLQVYDGFAEAGTFRTVVKTNNLTKGIYLLKISIDGNSTVEKLVIN